jgi:hypothetical protein
MGAVLAGTLGVAACTAGSTAATRVTTAVSTASPLATSLVTKGDSWAILPVSADPVYWQVLSRPTGSAAWRLVTPPGVADSGGIVATPSGGGDSLTAGILPSQQRTFSPLAVTSDGGITWAPAGPVQAPLAASPSALTGQDSATGQVTAAKSNLAALLGDGTIQLGQGSRWQTLAKPGSIAASPAGKGCGTVTISSLSFWGDNTVIAAGGCGTGGTLADFTDTPGTGWQRLPAPVAGQLVGYTDGMQLVRTKAGLAALWAVGWSAYSPLSPAPPPRPESAGPTGWTSSGALPVSGAPTASGTLAGLSGWVLLPGRRGAVVSEASTAGAKPKWRVLPQAPSHTAVLAAGPDSSVDALAVSGTTVTVWRLKGNATAWSRVQSISVPIQ